MEDTEKRHGRFRGNYYKEGQEMKILIALILVVLWSLVVYKINESIQEWKFKRIVKRIINNHEKKV